MPVKRKVKLFKLAGCAFFVIFALLYSHVEVGMSGNESGRFATIQAIAEQGVFHIEKCNGLCYRIGTEEIPKTDLPRLQQINWANRKDRRQVLAKAGFPSFFRLHKFHESAKP